MKDTKLISKQATAKQNTFTQIPKSFKKHENYKPKFSNKSQNPKIQNAIETKNKFQLLETEDDEVSKEVVISKNKPVFQKADPSMAVTLKEIMKKLEKMDKWQKDHQAQPCSVGSVNPQNSSQQNWRQSPAREMVSMTQEQKARWESQDRALSQSMDQ